MANANNREIKKGTKLYTAFDEYLIIRQIGQGGNGTVYGSAEKATEYWLRYVLEKGMPRGADLLNVNVPDCNVDPEEYLLTFQELHPYYKPQPVPERDWSKPYQLRFDSEFGDKDATEGSDIHTLQLLRKTSVTPITVDMTKR